MRILPIFGQPYDTGLLLLVVILVDGGWRVLHMAWRMSQSVPDDDAQAIARAFEGKQVERIDKLWFGGPWRIMEGRTISPHQIGRPYRVVLAGDVDDAQIPRIVADGTDARGDPVLSQRGPNGWTVISHVRPLPTSLVLTG